MVLTMRLPSLSLPLLPLLLGLKVSASSTHGLPDLLVRAALLGSSVYRHLKEDGLHHCVKLSPLAYRNGVKCRASCTRIFGYVEAQDLDERNRSSAEVPKPRQPHDSSNHIDAEAVGVYSHDSSMH